MAAKKTMTEAEKAAERAKATAVQQPAAWKRPGQSASLGKPHGFGFGPEPPPRTPTEMAKKAAAAMLLATNRLGGGSVAASSAVLRRLDASAPPAAAPSIHRAEGALYDQPGSQFGGELRVPADTIAASHEDDEDVLRELPIDDLTKQAWSVTWSSNLGPFFWYNYGMVGVPWPDASREQKVDAIVMALKGARFRDVKVKYRGQGQNKGRWAFSTLQITGGDGVFSASEQLLSAWELGGQTAKGADRSANVEDILRPTGVASFPVREAVVEQTKDRIREDLKKQSVPDRLAKGIKINTSGNGYEARYHLPTSTVPLLPLPRWLRHLIHRRPWSATVQWLPKRCPSKPAYRTAINKPAARTAPYIPRRRH